MTEQTIKSVREEAIRKEAERWRAKIRKFHNEIAFMGDTVDAHMVCDRLYEMMYENDEDSIRKEEK